MTDHTAADLAELISLPRPVYGHAESLPNRALGYPHCHSWIQISHADSGVVDVRTDTGRYIAPPQRAIWIPAGVTHSVHCSANTIIRSLYVAPTAITDRLREKCCVLEVSPLLQQLIRAFGELPITYDEAGSAGRLAAVLLDQLAAARELGLVLPLPREPRILHICQALEADPESRDGLGTWSARLRCSERTLSRLFRLHTGLTFRLWRQRLRLISSLPHLEAGQRVTDVAMSCGYDSVSAFIAAFHEHFGHTPGEFMARKHDFG